MSKSDLITYFEKLHVDKLQSTGSYVVYNVHDDEVIRARVFRLKAGMPIFADASGKPILKISCGNPMVAPTPKVTIQVKPTPPEQHHYEAPPAPTPPAPPVIVVPAAPAAPAPAPVAPVVNNYAGGTVTNNNSSSKVYSSLFILPVVLIFNNHHGHTTIIKKQPTPEPASMLIMGFGAASLMIRKRKASKASV